MSETTSPWWRTRILPSPGDAADLDCVQAPFFEDAKNFLLAAFLRHQQHALLRFAQHDLVCRHAGFALRHQIEFDFSSHMTARAHLAGGAGQPGGAHVLYADYSAGLHGFETGFEQKFFQERIAHLHVGPLGFGGLAELLAGHGGAVNAVASGFRSDVNHRIAFARSFGVEDLIAPDQTQRECIDQRIAGVAGLELGLAAQVGHAKTISIGGDSADHALEDRLILVNVLI